MGVCLTVENIENNGEKKPDSINISENNYIFTLKNTNIITEGIVDVMSKGNQNFNSIEKSDKYEYDYKPEFLQNKILFNPNKLNTISHTIFQDNIQNSKTINEVSNSGVLEVEKLVLRKKYNNSNVSPKKENFNIKEIKKLGIIHENDKENLNLEYKDSDVIHDDFERIYNKIKNSDNAKRVGNSKNNESNIESKEKRGNSFVKDRVPIISIKNDKEEKILKIKEEIADLRRKSKSKLEIFHKTLNDKRDNNNSFSYKQNSLNFKKNTFGIGLEDSYSINNKKLNNSQFYFDQQQETKFKIRDNSIFNTNSKIVYDDESLNLERSQIENTENKFMENIRPLQGNYSKNAKHVNQIQEDLNENINSKKNVLEGINKKKLKKWETMNIGSIINVFESIHKIEESSKCIIII